MNKNNKQFLEGSQAVAEIVTLCKPGVISAYPITPQTHIVEGLAQIIADGRLNSQFVNVESEHSAASVVLGAVATGVRVFTATSSQGLLYMSEVLFNIAGLRLPVIMTCANRAISAPINIWNDQQDSVSMRDTGWIQLYCETVQELFDTIIQGYKIVENPTVKLPMMVCEDGYWLTHSLEGATIPTQEEVDTFLPRYEPSLKDHLEPGGFSLFTSFGIMENWFSEFKYQQCIGETNALKIIDEVDQEFAKHFGRTYGGLLDSYMLDDAEVIMVGMGSVIATVRYTVNVMRSAGKKVGMVKIRSFRPFPKEKLIAAIGASKAKMIIVIEKTHFGALFDEVRSSLYDLESRPSILGFGIGINGRDVMPYNIVDLFEQGFKNIGNQSLPKTSQLYFIRKKELIE